MNAPFLKKQKLYRAKELSWMAFNARVLQEAENSKVPLIERFKFLGIYSNNLDEFFRVRVATLKRLSELDLDKSQELLGDDPKGILKELNQIVLEQRQKYEALQDTLIRELEKEDIFFIREDALTPKQKDFALRYFIQKVRPQLMPIMIDQVGHFPDLEDDAIYLAIILSKSGVSKERYALIKVPCDTLSRFLILPRQGSRKFMMFLDDVIRLGLTDLFHVFEFDVIQAYTIKVTKDAELDINDDVGESYVKKISRGLKKRDEADPVRFVYDAMLPEYFLLYLRERIGLGKMDAFISGGRYHNLKDFINIPNLGSEKLVYPPFQPIPHLDFVHGRSLFSLIRGKDILLHFPYHSFNYFIDLLREASIDPKVKSIKLTLYRLAPKSAVVNALVNAVRNGKQVTAVVELQARFDEQSNIDYSITLREEGVKVIYGVPGLKVHSKTCLITRKEKKTELLYAAVGTGNFNEESGRVFSDALLLTSNPEITDEVRQIYNFINRNYEIGNYHQLLPAPFIFRDRLTRLIRNEAEAARQGKPAYIHLKLNNLTDPDIIGELYNASLAGVEIKLNIRGMFSLVMDRDDPRIQNIQAIAIIDRWLEHTRLFLFCNGGDELCYISSADLMTRNLDRRVEVTCPILDPALKREFRDMFDIQWSDNVKARLLDMKLSNPYRNGNGEKKMQAQPDFIRYLSRKNNK